jgi:hypothetical protein
MEFKKIQLAKDGTLNVTYVDSDDNTITMEGANIVHRDLRLAMRALIPHLALLTEQREAAAATLKQLQAQDLSEEEFSVFKVLSVCDLSFSEGERAVAIGGCRILKGGRVMKVASPKTDVEDEEVYEYCGELQLALDAVKYEAKEYVTESKWGIKQAELFPVDDPFDGVQADDVPEVPSVQVEVEKKKRGRKVAAAV